MTYLMLEQASEKTARIEDMETISEYLLDDVTDEALSNNIGHKEVHLGSAPSNTFFSGTLSPSRDGIETDDDDIYSRISPNALHMIIRAVPDGEDATLAIKPQFDVFYRIFPRWEDQGIDEEDAVYRKLSPDIAPVIVTLPESADWDAIEVRLQDAEADLTEHIETALQEVYSEIRDDPLQYSTGMVGEQLLEDFHAGEFDDAETYSEHAADASRELQMPEFDVGVSIQALEREKSGPLQLKLSLENDSSDSVDPDLVDHTIFDAKLGVSAVSDLDFAPFRFTRLPEDYRYDRNLEGYGINCSVEKVEGADQKTLKTTCLPIHEQHRYRHKEPTDESSIPRFRDLAEDPVDLLRDLKSEMEAYRDRVWSTKISELKEEYGSTVADEAREQMLDFEDEIERFEHGISVLDEYAEIRWAFELMNETFDAKVRRDDGTREYDSWRLFQIVFIISNLPDLAARERPGITDNGPQDMAEVSLLWFPTGGGKTEAYLGLAVTGMHFDRIRGKKIGLTSMMRYPLRLLSLQQFQRITELFMYADEIREKHALGGDSYSVGYLTGGTENKLRDLIKKEFSESSLDQRETQKNLSKAADLEERWENDTLHRVSHEGHQFLNKCPKCGGEVVTRFNAENLTLDHCCVNEECDWDRLPIYVIDNEIYRELPTMVVGTQDKLAAIGYERKFRILLGHVKERCPDHGFTDGTECTEKYFCNKDRESHQPLNPKDPVPSLQIQDELHLIKEELGTFESHYWSAMEKIIEWSGHKKPKLIAATATIEAYENQIEHLYQRDANLFPAPGPEYRESFYATEDRDEVQRYFLGITPWNRSHINSVVSVLKAQQQAIQDLRDNLDEIESLQITDFNTIDSHDELDDVLRFYQTAVSYVISKKEGARIYTSIETQVNEDLTRGGYDEIDRMSLTGDSSFSAVSEMLERFEGLPDNPETAEDTEDVVIATSTISHGVDLDALNFMVFFGMPRRTAEYIQSSSRVGRKYPGIIVDVFHPIRERDRSHYHYFDKYHEYQDWLVEPVPVNRWAKFSVKRTLPGLFMSLILQRYYDQIYTEYGSPYTTKNVASAHASGMITAEQIVEDLCDIYGTDKHDSPVFKEVIERKVTQFMSAIDSKQKTFVSDSLPGDHGTMFSLRDVDQSIDIFTTKEDGRIVENLADKSGGDKQ
jgi:hypothetical protein